MHSLLHRTGGDGPHAWPFWLPYVVPALTVSSHYSTKSWHSLSAPVLAWIIVPLLDHFVGCRGTPSSTSSVFSPTQRKSLEARLSFKAAVLLWCPLQMAMLVWCAARASDTRLDTLRLLCLLASMGLIAAEGITCSHELLHRGSQPEALAAQLLLMSVCYGHFFIEHPKGHHKRVATPHDPATMRFGESFYHFLPRSIIGGFSSAWNIEISRLRNTGHSKWSFHNAMLWYVGCPFLLFMLPLWTLFGGRAVAFFCAQSLVAVIFLEQVNAMEHYGLQRKLLSSGLYENVGPEHSWDAPYTISNILMFMLQRHPDHHLFAGKCYQSLEVSPQSPQLPAGYLTLAPTLFIPPLWRAIIDPVLMRYLDARGRSL